MNSGNNGFVPSDTLDENDNGSTTETLPWDLDKSDGKPRIDVAVGTVDRGAYEFTCLGDLVSSATFQPPPDGVVDGADLAFLLGEWGPNPGSPADIVTSATFQPPPDGVVDGADLAVLLGAWGPCGGEQSMQGGGGEGAMADESGGGAISAGPFQDTEIGILLEELMATNDAELADYIAALLAEWMASE